MSMTPFYQSDRATLYLGDCLEVLAGLPAGSVDAVVTDPPYCSGGRNEFERAAATHQGLRSESIRSGDVKWFGGDTMGTQGITWLMRQVAVESRRLVKSGGSLLAFCDWRMLFSLGPAMESAGLRFRNVIAWDKEVFGTGVGFRPRHELIMHLTHNRTEFHSRSVGNVIPCGRVPRNSRTHPTEKPVELIEKLLSVVAGLNALILDPFAGSGTTGVAALQTGRRFVGVEIDERYAEIAAKRLARAETEARQPTLFEVAE